MKTVLLLLAMVHAVAAQFVVPKKGWKLIEKGDGEEHLGTWEKVDQSVTVETTWLRNLPELKVLLGFGDFDDHTNAADPTLLPKNAEVLKVPHLGLRIRFTTLSGDEKDQEHIWIYDEEGGVMLTVVFKKGDVFSLDDWKFDPSPADPEGVIRGELTKIVKLINELSKLPKIELDDIQPPAVDANHTKGPSIRVEIRVGGKYFIEEKEMTEESLASALKKAHGEGVVLLCIAAEKEAEFEFVKRVLKLATAAGIDQLAYGAYLEKKE